MRSDDVMLLCLMKDLTQNINNCSKILNYYKSIRLLLMVYKKINYSTFKFVSNFLKIYCSSKGDMKSVRMVLLDKHTEFVVFSSGEDQTVFSLIRFQS